MPVDIAALAVDRLPPGYRPFKALIECRQRDGNGLRLRALDPRVALTFDVPPPGSGRGTDRGERHRPVAQIRLRQIWAGQRLRRRADRDPARLAVPIALRQAMGE